MGSWIMVGALLLAPTLGWAKPVVVQSQPHQVTVFPGGALVTREARVRAAPGVQRFVLAGFPARMRDSSVRVLLDGPGRPHLVGFAVERIPVEETVSPEARRLEAEIEKLGDQDRVLADQLAVLGDRQAFVRSLRQTYRKRVVANMALGPIDTAGWSAVYGFSGTRLDALGEKRRQVQHQRRELARKLALARRRLALVASQRAKQTKSVAVDVRAARAGAIRVAIRYLVPGARWRTVYDAYLEGDKLRFVHYGIVSQRTGEDWNEVKLVLSSASVAQWVRVPKLGAQNLSFRPPRRRWLRGRGYRRRYRRYSRRRPSKTKRSMDGAAKDEATAAPPPPPPPKPKPQAVATTRVAEFAASYDLPGKVSVPSKGAPRKIAVAVISIPVSLRYLAVPRLRAGAFLVARGTYDGGVPLLPGRVSLFLGKDYVGRTRLGFLSSGAKLRLSFGRDDRLRVRRRRVAYKVHTQGVFTKEYKIDYRWRFDVENLVGRPIELALLDRVPVSMDERIKVELHDDTSPRAPLRPDDAKGTVRFALKLAPGGKQTLRLGYSVVYPRKLHVSGLR